MSRINTNLPSLVAQRTFTMQNDKLNQSLVRLSTGLRINTGKDDPAGLIASEALRAEKVATQAAITNVARANNVISVAEAGLVETSKLLKELEDLIDRSANEAGISEDERNANQLQIDSILESINRIANSTEFQGRKLLSGDLAYTTSSVSSTDISNVTVTAAKLPNGGYRSVVVEVTASAQLAGLTYTGSTVTSAVTIEVAGRLGTDTFSFAAGTAISAIANAINQSTSVTGVSATAATSSLDFNSTGYGSSQFVSVRALNGTFTVTGGDAGSTKDYGENATVLINGNAAITDGLRASTRSSSLSMDIDLSAAFGTSLGSTTFQIVGGGADFMIAPEVSQAGLASIGIASVSTGVLGNGTDGVLASLATGQSNQLSSGNYAAAQRILRDAQDQISFLQGRLGAFQKDTLETTSNALKVTFENLAAAESVIRDADFAEETASLTRQQILVQSSTSVLRLANQSPQSVLALLQ